MATGSAKSSKSTVAAQPEPQSLVASAAGSSAASTSSTPVTGLGSFAAVANATAFPGPPAPAPLSPLLGSINLSPDQTKLSTEQLQTEISTTVSLGGAMYVISSGGGSTLQVTNASMPQR